ncbi:MAG TPA: glycosyltransferase family 39 protein [Acidimicrobiales bacterium]|jgi:4-amino-4-deoxy-L-arabinose transferase-like glycosyltransferase|nr:glycosyltransferase family 39 protein [Acidimicrobiales bacterium]
MRSGGSGADPGRPVGRSWWPWLAGWTALGLIIRVASVLGRPHLALSGDAWYYHWAAIDLVDGKGFINPLTYSQHHVTQGADFPPGFIFLLAAAALVGVKGVLAQRIWVCIVGSAGIVLVGLVGREIGGRRVGLIAALIVAVYPNIWISDGLAMSEAVSPILVALILLTAYRFYRRPGISSAVWLGLSIGLAALTRDELSLLGLFIFAPLTLGDRTRPWPKRFGVFAAGVIAALLVVAPWVGYNLSRFQDPVFISSGLGVTLASNNCAATYSGHLEGYWYMPCAGAPPVAAPGADESVQGSIDQRFAMDYMKAHAGRLPVVLAARFGRAFGLYRPIEQLQLDAEFETRPFHWAEVALYGYYALSVGAVAGAVILRRRRVPVLPILAVGATVVVSVLMTFGDTRYRTTWEISLALLAAVAIDRVWSAARPEPATAFEAGPAPAPALAEAAAG